MPISLLTFLVLSLAMAALFTAGLALAGPSDRMRWTLVGLVVAAVYLVVSGSLAASGLIADGDARPPPAGVMLLGLSLGTVALAFSRVGDRLLRLPLALLVGFQAFRIVVELALASAYGASLVPVEVTYHGLNFDVLSGVFGALLGLWLWRGSPPRWLVGVWNGVGLALLAVVVVTSALSIFGVLATEPRMTLPTMWPGVWLPAWLVQLAFLGHLLVFRALRRR